MALILRNGGSQSPDRWLREPRNNHAIIKMIESGLNQAVIMDLTGQGIDVFSDCQNIVDNRNGFSRNRYINHMIRGIDTYDDM